MDINNFSIQEYDNAVHSENESLKKQCRNLWSENKSLKWKYSLYSGLLFFLIASPQMFSLVQYILGKLFTVAVDGCPTGLGLIIHTVVFVIAIFGLMNLPKDL